MEAIVGLHKLEQTLKQLEKVPQRIVTKSSRKGASVVYKQAKKDAPVDQGNLKKGIKIVAEKTRTKGKKVYQITMNRQMNNVFVKQSSTGKRAYYPASQEYGFFTKNGRYIPGFNYLRGSNASKRQEAQQIIVKTAQAEVDKIL